MRDQLMNINNNTLLQRIEELKTLDSIIDFSRSTLQLEIVFAFINSGQPLTPSELSLIIEERRKAVLDALRKLEIKNIVRKIGVKNGEGLYDLEETGKKYAEQLLNIMNIKRKVLTQSVYDDGDLEKKSKRVLIQNKLVEAHYIYMAIIYLANAPGQKLSLKKLSELLGLSPDRARSYLDLFSRPPNRVFRRIVRTNRSVYYKLEKNGLNLYYRTPVYQELKKSVIARIRLKNRMRLSKKAGRATILPMIYMGSIIIMTMIMLQTDQDLLAALGLLLTSILTILGVILP